jgi:flagellar biosynthetic protein FliR
MIVSLPQAQIFFLALTRILAILIQVPVLGGNTIPTQVRIAFGLVLTIIVVPWQPLAADAQVIQLLPFAFSILRELVIGMLAGFAATLTFGAVQIAGEMMTLGAGFSASRILNPILGEGGSPIDTLFTLFAVTLFLVINGHHVFILSLRHTFDLIPVGAPLPSFLAEPLLRLTAQIIALGIQMALPVIAALFLTDLTLGLLARVAPQVQVYFLGLPAKIGIGLIVISLTLAIGMPQLTSYLQGIGPWMLKLMGN